MTLEEILEEYKAHGYSEELAQKFRDTDCSECTCDGCPMDEQVGTFIACDHLLHGEDNVTHWGEK